ncbi:helix-turn-helix domain-containing protein [Yersinia sp. 2541 StPb PI]|uniref:helix-turn-helix domain-containing protein n=1 Tax=Yersinia sp. 2541 StPb PI TaxID=3117407 RepID=UPI003FA40A9F
MMNLIIFSRSGLILFSLRKMVMDVMENDPSLFEITLCTEFSKFVDILLYKNDVICIFDIDGISEKEQGSAIGFIKERFGIASLLILSKNGTVPFISNVMIENQYAIASKKQFLSEIGLKFLNLVRVRRSGLAQIIGYEKVIDDSEKDELTVRQRQVLKLIISGMNVNQISKKIGISNKTVYNHRKNIYKKYNVGSDLELYYKVREMLSY